MEGRGADQQGPHPQQIPSLEGDKNGNGSARAGAAQPEGEGMDSGQRVGGGGLDLRFAGQELSV